MWTWEDIVVSRKRIESVPVNDDVGALATSTGGELAWRCNEQLEAVVDTVSTALALLLS